MVVYYNCHETLLRSFFRWRSTLTSSIITGWEFWTILATVLAFTLLIDFDVVSVPPGLKDLKVTTLTGPVLSFSTFTAVFYIGQCYSRYLDLYKGCMDVDTEVKVLVAELLSDFGFDPSLRKHVLACTKYVVASTFFFHISMTPTLKEEEWATFTEKGLLSKVEVDAVRGFPCHIVLLLHHWAQKVVFAALNEPATKERFTPPERSGIAGRCFAKIDRLSRTCRDISNTLNLPIPFPYFHLLQLLIVIAVGLSAFLCCVITAQAKENTYAVAVVPVAALAFALLSLRRLSGELSDPFGQDGVDFPSFDFMRHIQDHCVAMLRADAFYDPLDGLADTTEFASQHVLRPCDPARPDLPPKKTGKSVMDPNPYQRNDHGPRVWHTPEDYSSGQNLRRWLEGEPKQRKATERSSVREAAERSSVRETAERSSVKVRSVKSVRTTPWTPLRNFGSMSTAREADGASSDAQGAAHEMLGPAKIEINAL
mmetsp:Transcript_95735/g.298100  ORF Transcript_95735/g.298100 Transcript_95735/m.298100 type:complete len:482 (-) Transcript_95735:282-1727(-)